MNKTLNYKIVILGSATREVEWDNYNKMSFKELGGKVVLVW